MEKIKEKQRVNFNFEQFATNWKAPVVMRSDIDKFSVGLLHLRTLANIDCKGEGPEIIQIGKRLGYPVEPFQSY